VCLAKERPTPKNNGNNDDDNQQQRQQQPTTNNQQPTTNKLTTPKTNIQNGKQHQQHQLRQELNFSFSGGPASIPFACCISKPKPAFPESFQNTPLGAGAGSERMKMIETMLTRLR